MQHAGRTVQRHQARTDRTKVSFCTRLPLSTQFSALAGPSRPWLRKYRTCIFVNGCFWHGHEGYKYFTIPKTNSEFWNTKIARNKQRDLEVCKQLASMGWHTIVVWECELKRNRQASTLASLAFTLNHLYLSDHSVHYIKMEEESEADKVADSLIVKFWLNYRLQKRIWEIFKYPIRIQQK